MLAKQEFELLSTEVIVFEHLYLSVSLADNTTSGRLLHPQTGRASRYDTIGSASLVDIVKTCKVNQ